MATEGGAVGVSSSNPEGGGGAGGSDRPRGPRGGGGRGRGQHQHHGGRGGGGRGGGGGARRGEGRGAASGGRGGNSRSQHGNNSNDTETLPPTSTRVTTDKSKLVPKIAAAAGGDEEEDVEAEVCFICASPVEHNSVGPCNHRTCHICALRMRALYKNTDCAHCRTPADSVIFTDNATKHYQDFNDADIHKTDVALGIRYEKQEIWEDTVLLLRYNCPDAECDVACLGWPDLHRHVKATHGKMICDLCSKHKKVFTHEHELLTAKELQQHMRKGDDNPGAVDQSGFKGHPLCSFCGTRFYGDDELYVHCRDSHERCHICERINGGQPVYFVNPDALADHYRKAADHFPCPDPECVKAKVIVYDTLMDLKAHQLEQHGSSLDKDGRRDARAVDISGFNYRPQYVPERRGGGQNSRGRGRGRDPNAEPLPASTAQPLRRDEQAFQRQMAIASAQSTTARTFGGSLTATSASTQTRSPAPQSQTIHPPSSSAGNIAAGIADLDLQESQTPQEQARALRHRSVIERAEILLQNDSNKINRFRSFISSYRGGAINAKTLIDSFFALFTDTSSTSIGTLIQEVADLFEDKSKAQNIRVAWNDWRAINEDYPSLPGPGMGGTTTLPGLGWASITASASTPTTSAPSKAKSSRVLKLKSSTAQSSRSQTSKSASWGGSISVPLSVPSSSSASSAAVNFPALESSRPQPTSSKVTTTPWAPTPISATNSAPGSARPTPPSSRPVSRGPQRGQIADFPALPPAAKPQSTIFGYGRGVVRRDGWGNAPTNSFSWGQAGNGERAGAEEVSEEVEGGGGKKGKKGKKVLVAWG